MIKSIKPKKHIGNSLGFSVPVLLIAIMAVFSVILAVMLYVDYSRRGLANTRDSRRLSDIRLIYAVVEQGIFDNPKSIAFIPRGESCGLSNQQILRSNKKNKELVDLSKITNDKRFLNNIPIDPIYTNQNATGYYIFINTSSKRITICAPLSETKIVQVSY